MPKTKNGSKTKGAPGVKLSGGARTRVSAMEAVDKHTFTITDAKLKDDLCHYGFEITEGAGLGDPCNIKGSNLIKDEMREAFAQLRVHLAFIDDVFKYQGVEIEDIDKMHGHELTGLFNVTGFKIKGGDENESIILIGNKYLSSGSRMELESPAIPLDNLSSYKWYNELKSASDAVRLEVALYKEGFYTPVKEEEDEDSEPSHKQMKIGAAEPEFVDDFENE